MMTRSLIAFALTFGLLPNSFASPSVYINESNKLHGMVNTVGAKIIGDHQNSKAVYVLPPSLGTVELKNFRATTNLSFCDELADLVKYSRARTTELGTLAAKREKVLEAQLDVEAGKSAVESELKKLHEESPVINQYEKLNKDRSANATALEKLEKENFDLFKRYKELMSVRKELQASFEELDKRYNILEGRIIDIKKVFDGLYEKFAKREGGFANFTYDTGWDEQVSHLQQANPSYQFERVFTKDVKIYARFVGSSDKASYEASLPAILDYVVNGESQTNADKPQALASMPTKMSAHVRLSLAGACALVNPKLFNIQTNEAGSPVFGLSATYQFPSVFSANVKVTYNRHAVYNQMKKEAKGTAVFTTKQMKRVQDGKDAWADMKVEWQDNSDGEVTEAEKQKVIADIRKEIMAEVLEITGIPNPERDHTIIETTDQDPWSPRSRWNNRITNGGYTGGGYGGGGIPTSSSNPNAGDMLLSTCEMGNIYCVLGGFIMRGMNAIFGGDKVDAEFYNKVNAMVTRELSTKSAQLRTGITVFINE